MHYVFGVLNGALLTPPGCKHEWSTILFGITSSLSAIKNTFT